MKNEAIIILEKVKLILDEQAASIVDLAIEDSEMRVLDESPSKGKVAQLLPTLRVRQSNAIRANKDVKGIDRLISTLSTMNPADVVVGYSVISPRFAGAVYFDSNNDAIGAVITKR